MEVDMEEDLAGDMEEDLAVNMEEDLAVDMEEDLVVDMEEDLVVDMKEDLAVDTEEDLAVDMVGTLRMFCTPSSILHYSWRSTYRHSSLMEAMEEIMEETMVGLEDLGELGGILPSLEEKEEIKITLLMRGNSFLTMCKY